MKKFALFLLISTLLSSCGYRGTMPPDAYIDYGHNDPDDGFQTFKPNAYAPGVGMDQYGRRVRHPHNWR